MSSFIAIADAFIAIASASVSVFSLTASFLRASPVAHLFSQVPKRGRDWLDTLLLSAPLSSHTTHTRLLMGKGAFHDSLTVCQEVMEDVLRKAKAKATAEGEGEGEGEAKAKTKGQKQGARVSV